MPEPQLFVVVLAVPGNVQIGQTVRFYIGYGNDGAGTAQGVTLTGGPNGCFSGGSFNDSIGDLGPNSSSTKAITLTATAAGNCSMDVTISAVNTASTADSAGVTVTP